MHNSKKSSTFVADCEKQANAMRENIANSANERPANTSVPHVLTKQEIAEHYVSLEQLHEDLTALIKNFYKKKTSRKAVAV